MSHPLEERVRAVARSAAWLVWLYGLCRLVAAVAAVVLVLALFDFTFRLEGPVGRWLLSLAALGAAAAAGIKLLLPALGGRPGDVATARRIERRFPVLGERLSSAIAFLHQREEDATAGSPSLRRAVVAEANALASGLDFSRALDRRPTRRAAWLALGTCAFAAVLAALQPTAAGLAASRLALPWRDQPWPRRTELAFVDPPDRLAAGSNLELAVIDRRGALPAKVELQLRHAGASGTRIEIREMSRIDAQMVYRLDNVSQSFAYRARGGDDDTMPWREVYVVEPPQVLELATEVLPPAYTRLPPRHEGRVVKALAGSGLRIRGRLDQPIAQARLRSETPDLALPEVEISADGKSFVAPPAGKTWQPDKSVAVWLEMTDGEGVEFGRDARIEVQLTADALPIIAWESPGDHAFATPQGSVPVRALVKDDLAVRSVHLRYLRPGSSEEEQVIALYPPGDTPTNGETATIESPWDLSQLVGLAAGDVLAVRLTAEDHLPQLATTTVRRLTIVTETEMESRIAQRQTAILGQLTEALRHARQAREQAGAVAARLEESGRIEAGDLNQLQSGQHNHREVERLLADTPDGVAGQLASLLAELTANRLASETLRERLSQLLEQVQAIRSGPLAAIDQRLNDAFKLARDQLNEDAGANSSAGEAAAMLREAQPLQDSVIEQLEALLGNLAEWDSFQRLAREVGEMRAEQEQLAEATEALRLQALAASGDAIAQQQAGGARPLAQRQLELARRFDKLQSRMQELLPRLTDDALAGGKLADALAAARRQAIGGRMREAATSIGQVELGQGRQSQQAALEGLSELLSMLSSRRDFELSRTAKALAAAAAELDQLRSRAGELANEARQAARENDEQASRRRLQTLQKQLEQLTRDVEELSRRLQRLRAERARKSLAAAAGAAQRAAAAAGSGDGEAAADETEQLEQQLEQAQEEIARAQEQTEEQLASEQRVRTEQLIAALIARQKNVVSEVERLNIQRPNDENLDEAFRSALRNLAAEQRDLAEEATRLRQQLGDSEAFDFALEGAAAQMRQADLLLTRGETGDATQRAARAALKRLELIRASLQPADPPPAEASGDQPMPPAESPPPGNLAAALAEIKLLHALQQQLNEQTLELQARQREPGGPQRADEAELAALALEQGRLADMLLNLIPIVNPPKESQPSPADNTQPDKPLDSLDAELLRDLEQK